MVSSTSSSVHLSWDVEKDQPINEPSPTPDAQSTEDAGDWTEVQTGSERSAYAFRGLRCGRNYAFYAVAFNAAGRGPRSNTILAKTDGSAPVAPDERDVLLCNVTSVTLQLSSWKSGGCPILSFAVLCKPQSQKEWSTATATHLIPDNKQPPVLVIPDLNPATWYDLLITAENDAGATEAEYVFATLTPSGGTLPPPQWTKAVESPHRHIRIIIPIACTILAMLLISAAVCYVFSRRRLSAIQRPYSAYRAPMEEPEDDRLRPHHTYDVPFLRRPPDSEQDQTLSIIEGYPNSNVSYVYSRPKKKHWGSNDEEIFYAEHKMRNLARYADELKSEEVDSRESGLEFAVDAYELSEAECDMPTRHCSVQT
ncbi:hypothetical protein HPB52_020249 [Rhipicephalus sanguineus]|uniref:Fibronectin type-III domain-containing protein n=1 Tax=Rhipicephalus sanguineus TaxID=34632 RepID=A0A9D4Q757_RHISA|nr:hypothetical protein HPB52_020249 [Rhipicephalus sanguineus]